MKNRPSGETEANGPVDLSAEAWLALRDAPVGFAITRGPEHLLVYANRTFCQLADCDDSAVGRRFAEVCTAAGLASFLDRAFNEALPALDELIPAPAPRDETWTCSLWPVYSDDSDTHGVLIEVRGVPDANLSLDLQRKVAERLLLGALREMEAAATAEAARQASDFLAEAGRELAASVDESTTRETVTHLRLPGPKTWCFVDVMESTGTLYRLAIVHPDPTKRAIAHELQDRWSPEPGDPFGAPAVMQSRQPVSIVDEVDQALARSTRDPDTGRALQELGIGSLLTVPMNVRGRPLGAITFVGRPRAGEFTPEEVELAQALALRSAVALDNARMYGEALELKAQAQEGSRAKSEFLANMSHELRTPLNAIAGFVDIIDLGIHGPVTDEQRSDLARIRSSQNHLLVMINDILSFMQINRGRLDYHIIDLTVNEVLEHARNLVEPLARGKELDLLDVACPPDLMIHADPDRTQQILSNLLTNAIKFTPAGGTIGVACEAHDDIVHMTVSDSGIGISGDKIEAVFDPFYQVSTGLSDREGGVGLGLAISRDLARAMGGDLTVESVAGEGSRFTLTLPIGHGDDGVPPDDDA